VRAPRLADDVKAFLAARRTELAAAGVVLMLGLAVLLVALAADLLRWDRELERGDASFASGASIREAAWEPQTTLPTGMSRALLAVDDDLDYRGAVKRFWLSGPREPIREFSDVTRRTGAEREIARVGEADGNRARRAQLAILRGALLLEEARNSPVQREVFVRRAVGEFSRAAALDPANEEALYNLELALRLLRRAGSDSGEGQNARSPLPAPGAGSATSGGGF
jgi:hypothetical protein